MRTHWNVIEGIPYWPVILWASTWQNYMYFVLLHKTLLLLTTRWSRGFRVTEVMGLWGQRTKQSAARHQCDVIVWAELYCEGSESRKVIWA